MVSQTTTQIGKLDPVAQRLIATGDRSSEWQSHQLIDWLRMQAHRHSMIRQVFWSTFGAWLLVTAASVISCLIAIQLSIDLKNMSDETGLSSDNADWWRWIAFPAATVIIACFFLIGGIVGAIFGVFPGYRSTRSAIDWACASDAVSRLLQTGCTYPEAFATTARAMKTRRIRNWLERSANRVEQGGSVLEKNSQARKDTAMLEALVGPTVKEPAYQWGLASEHFLHVAESRLTLIRQTAPLLSTLVSGVLLWFTLNLSLGWLWAMVADLISGLT
ncbi:hypothetical protein Q31b_43490 [Novipirellula aureliae]|uniref:Bacterial type II secretion system protein F domain protein n=1 Tax=Novipirellula aureliae TaxID=2527966 RepID=A0A5C6DPJ0_9BACT|nr:hypothetical protein [Novipirellula aureliae]TWU37561.1 hypothetical protein Q31b_43490 [Novipirellula aureliae]